MAKRLSELQYAAIAILAMPKRGGMTYDQVAEKVGVSRQTLYEWRNQDAFNDEMKKQVLRNAIEHLPDMYASIPQHVIQEGNAALFRTYLQSLGMLTEKVEVDNKSGNGSADIDAMKAEIERMKGKRKEGE
ncbi:phBC6A51 family helix-turn-helix protein [Lederbergia citri]|uniref:Helix-turn-helix domain-containing protein n=1 Tax=Lederbergia citri TaxID=2833580 RepID=A0A942TCV4_9BACI|nr:phBC6A51 family helix-turn-helix protein [Lederbergia citri]MBS4195340.1 helix-turn-helix domain-containing protein [Lederbergia citri]